MKTYITRYTLHNGATGELYVIATSSCAAIVTAINVFGDRLCKCGARRA